LTIVASTGLASAEKAKSRTGQEKAAKKACSVGDFQKGVDILSDLFVETSSPTYVYNQGRCYQQNNRWEQAIGRFREYLRIAKDLTDSDKADADQQIADCERSLGKSAQLAPPPAVAAPPPIARTETPAPVSETPTPPVVVEPAPLPLEDDHSKSLRTAGVVCAAVGLAAVGAGVGLALKTQSISSDEQKHVATVDRENQRKSLETWGWVSYGVGAAAIATGTVLYIVGRSSYHASSVALLPILAPDGVSMMVWGSMGAQVLANRVTHAHAYSRDTAAAGMCPVWWDNGGSGKGSYAIFDRTTGAQTEPTIVNAIVTGTQEGLASPGTYATLANP
jgi:hypothetical protein